MNYLGIDLGGTNIKGGVVSETGEILREASRPTHVEQGPDAIADGIAALIRELEAGETLGGVGLGCPGTVDDESGEVVCAFNLGLIGYDLRGAIRARTGYSIRLGNDANLAALAEATVGAGRGAHSTVVITLGTGVGGGVVLEGKMLTGWTGAACELGHMVIEEGGEPCTCGRRGCFEAYSSATALIRRTKTAMAAHPESLMHAVAEENGAVDGRTAFTARERGDAAAAEVVREYVKYLASGVTNVINIFFPEVIAFSGGIANQGEALLAPLREEVARQEFGSRYVRRHARIVRCELGYQSGIIGAALLSRDEKSADEFEILNGTLFKYLGTGGDVVIPNGVMTIDKCAFEGCAGLTSVTLPESVTTIGDSAFGNCENLTDVILPQSVTTIGGYAFGGCVNLQRIVLPESVASMGPGCFMSCEKLTHAAIPSGVGRICENTFYGCTSLQSVALPEGLELIDDNAFGSCVSLTGVILPHSMKRFGNYPFMNCTSLTQIAMPEGVENVDEMTFCGCDALTEAGIIRYPAGKKPEKLPPIAEKPEEPVVGMGAEELVYVPREDFGRFNCGGDEDEDEDDREIDSALIEAVLERVNEVLPPQPIFNFRVSSVEEGELSVFDSKLGGTPYFPKDMAYPRGKSGDYAGKPLALLAQLNFEELPQIPDFPAKGILQFFIAPDGFYGWNPDDCTAQENFRVIYHETILRDETKLLSANDIPDFKGSDLPLSGEYRLEARDPELMPATTCDYQFQRAFVQCYNELADEPIESIFDLDDEVGEALFDSDDTPEAYVGGYPVFAQSDPRDDDESLTDCEVLLFELDSFQNEDRGVEVIWGDVGTGSFMIPRDRLKKLDFSRVLYNYDCY